MHNNSLALTRVHVERQRLADVSRGKQAGPGGAGFQFAHFIVARQRREMGRSHCGHEQGPVVGLQSGWRVQFVERPRRPVRLGLRIRPALWRVRMGVGMSMWVGVTVRVLQAWVQPRCIRVHGIGRGTHVAVGATLGRGVVAVPEGRREVSSAG